GWTPPLRTLVWGVKHTSHPNHRRHQPWPSASHATPSYTLWFAGDPVKVWLRSNCGCSLLSA
ncbi:unnamed protein product, partial [Linum tenue]